MTFQPWQYIAARLEYNFLNDSSDAVRDNEELVSIAVQNKSSIEHASDRLRAYKPTVLLAVNNDYEAIQHISDELRDDDDVVRAAVSNTLYKQYDWWCCAKGLNYSPTSLGGLSCASDRLRDNSDIVMTSVSVNGYSLKFASDRLRDDDEIVLQALKATDYQVLRLAPERMRSDRRIVQEAVAAGEVEHVSPKLLTKELVEVAVRKRPSVYSALPARWRDDDDILRIAIESGGSCLEFANDKQKSDFDIVKLAVEKAPLSIKFSNLKTKDREKIIEVAVTNGLLLPEKYFSNEELVFANLQNIKEYQNRESGSRELFYEDWYPGDWLKKMVTKHSSSKKIAVAAIQTRGQKSRTDYFELFDDKIKSDLDFCRIAISAESYIYNLLPEEMKNNRDLALDFIESSSMPELKKLPESLRADGEIVKKCLLKWAYNIDDLPPQFESLPEAFRAKVLRSFDGSNLTDHDLQELYANPDLLIEAAEKNPRIFMLRRGLQNDRRVLLEAARRMQSNYGSSILDELASDYEVLELLEFIPENIPPAILSDREFIRKRVLGPHGFDGFDIQIQSDEELIKLYLEAGSRDVSRRYDVLPAHIKKRESIVLFAISVGAISWLHMIPEKLQNDDRILNAFYDWLQKNPST